MAHSVTIRRLRAGDEGTLAYLALHDGDFDIDGRGEPQKPLTLEAAQKYLANDAVLFWVALDGDLIVGFLSCLVVPMRSVIEQELLLYEIGVLHGHRRQGIGRALMDHMEAWMRANDVGEVWVGADNAGAVEFYRAFGFEAADAGVFLPVYMARELE